MMQKNLHRIDEWLKLYAPALFEHSLNRGASDQDLADLEEIIGFSLPEEFKELYRWHNGLNDETNMGNLFYGLDFYPIERIIEEYEGVERDGEVDALKRYSKEIDYRNIYNKKWIIIGSDSEDCFLVLDMAPADGGTVGQVIFIDTEEEVGILVADSIGELVADLADDLEADRYYPLEEAAEDGHDFLEVVDEIDIVNWWTAERWQGFDGLLEVEEGDESDE